MFLSHEHDFAVFVEDSREKECNCAVNTSWEHLFMKNVKWKAVQLKFVHEKKLRVNLFIKKWTFVHEIVEQKQIELHMVKKEKTVREVREQNRTWNKWRKPIIIQMFMKKFKNLNS